MNKAWQTFDLVVLEDDSFATDFFEAAFLAAVTFATFAFTADVATVAV